MTDHSRRPSRRNQILQALATMLEENPGCRITTAALAKTVGVSEVALYRHFPSKAKMFEGLIEFVETTIFSRITRILGEEIDTREKCGQVLLLVLTFSERNPGITRLLTGDALAGETSRLRRRMAQLFHRLETQLRQVLREAQMRGDERPITDVNAAATLMLAVVEGRVSQFVRSDFQRPPTQDWEQHWKLLGGAIFTGSPSTSA